MSRCRLDGSPVHSGRVAVLVDKSTEDVDALDPVNLRRARRGRLTVRGGHAQADAPMWSGGVVMLHVHGEHLLEVPAAPDQQSVKALVPDRAHPALREGARLGRPGWNLEYLDPGRREHGVEGGGELRACRGTRCCFPS